MSRLGSRCGAAALGLVIDRLLGEPPSRVHPVAAFGTVMGLAERKIWRDRRTAGASYAAVGVTMGALGGVLVRSPALAVGSAAAGRELRRVAIRIGEHLAADDLDGARSALPTLVGRDPSELDESGIAAAVIESVAENTVDAVVAPVLWAVLAGAPGAVAYRAINTMDAMVGRRNERYENFGWASARVDDAANWLPARLFAALVAAQEPTDGRRILVTVARDAGGHPSPNAGVAEAAVAAALGCELGGPLRYGDLAENRPRLGTGPRPTGRDIPRAVAISNTAEILLLAALAIVWASDRLRSSP